MLNRGFFLFRVWSPRQASGLHASRDRFIRRVYHQGDHDVLRLDLRHGDQGDRRAAAVLVGLPGSAEREQDGEESQVSSSSLGSAPVEVWTTSRQSLFSRLPL